jgi:protein disulfide-isomerase A1
MINCFFFFVSFLWYGMILLIPGITLLIINPFWFSQDGTANDIPTDLAVEGYPTIYFYSTTGDLYNYNGGRTAEDIISFIKKNKGPRAGAVDEVTQTGAGAVEEGITSSSPSGLPKDEL